VVLVSGIAVLWWLADGEGSAWLFNGGLFAHSAACALLIVLSTQARETLVTRVLGWSPLQWSGQVSYSLYLWHWPVFVLVSPELGWGRTMLAHAVSIGLAALSKYLVEDPIRFRARWATGPSGVVAFVAVMIALAALWLLLPAPAPPAIDITRLS
jgi:peptidoglycan/LPS O-acetylase OafA/YrhL